MLSSTPHRMPKNGQAPNALVMFLHGYGANGDDLIGIGDHWAQVLPEVAFVSPHAPNSVPGYPAGRQWFPISRLDPLELDRGAAAAEADVRRLIDAALAEFALTADRLVLIGFSQGTMMSLQVGLRLAPPPALIVGFSGALPNAGTLSADPARPWPPVLLVHGDADDVVPMQASEAAAARLEALGVEVLFGLARGLGHGISPEGLNHAASRIREALALPA